MEPLPQTLPFDEYNRQLRDNCAPEGWESVQPSGRYNLVVVGAGTAGLVAAAAAAELGAKVALIERELLGGDCLNVGCIPSKCLLAAGRSYAACRDAVQFGVRLPGKPEVDFGVVVERMRRLRAGLSKHGSATRFRDELGVDVFFGHAKFIRPGVIRVWDKDLLYGKALICTGARALKPDIPGLSDAGFLTNETVFSLSELPKRLLVIGGGPAGCELAQAFRRFGSEVTLVEMASHLLPMADEDASKIVLKAFEREGIRVLLNSAVRRVEGGDAKVAEVVSGDEVQMLETDRILVAVGRAPNVEDLGLETVGVTFDIRRGVHVDDRLRTANKDIFAAGDCCMRSKFTHAAEYASRTAVRNALFKGRGRLSSLLIPWCTYTDPEVAHIGMSERDARELRIETTPHRKWFAEMDRSVAEGHTRGFVKILVKAGTDKVLGATIVGPNAGDMIGEIAVAMKAGLRLRDLADVIHPYPTEADAIRAVADMVRRARRTPLVKRLLAKWLAWQRR